MKLTTFKILFLFMLSALAHGKMINGAGASFPYPIYSKWFNHFNKESKEAKINYQAVGSGNGIRQLIAQTVDFAASDVPLKDKEKKALKKDVLQIPTVIGAVAIAYRLDEIKDQDLVINADVLSEIYLGKIKMWNDKKIAALNPKVNLPAVEISAVSRSDSSGTTAIFTGFLGNNSKEFQEEVGVGKKVRFKAGIGGKGNPGVTSIVSVTNGSIGYLELAYAINNKLKYMAVMNKANKAIIPTIESISLSAKAFSKSKKEADSLTGDIIDSVEENAYPITAMTYLLIPADIKEDDKKSLQEFISFAMDKGQAMAKDLHYAPLPNELRELVLKKVQKL